MSVRADPLGTGAGPVVAASLVVAVVALLVMVGLLVRAGVAAGPRQVRFRIDNQAGLVLQAAPRVRWCPCSLLEQLPVDA